MTDSERQREEDGEHEDYYEEYEEDYENNENSNYKCGIRNEKGAGVYIRRFELRVI